MAPLHDIVRLTAPWVVGIAAYLSALRAFLWAAEQLEGKVSTTVRDDLILKLDKWWEQTRGSTFPVLAQEECRRLVENVEAFIARDGKFLSFKVTFSFWLTTLAFFLGRLLWSIAKALDIRVESLELVTSHAGTTESLDRPYLWSLFLIPEVYFLRSTWLALRERSNRPRVIAACSIRYILLIFFMSNLLDLFDSVALGGVHLLPGMLEAVVLAIIAWKLPNLVRRIDAGVIRIIKWTAASLAILLLFDAIDRSSFWQNKIYTTYYETVFYASNFVFDLLTLAFTFWVLKKISYSGTLKNTLWIAVDVLVASIFAGVVYWLVYLNNIAAAAVLFGDLGNIDFLSMFESVIQDTRDALVNFRLNIIFFAMTTLIPTIAYFSILSVRFLGRSSWLIINHLSRFFFYSPDPERKRSPVYLTLVTISLVISLVPAYVGWFSTREIHWG